MEFILYEVTEFYASDVAYNLGHEEKGNGAGTTAGYWLEKVSAYMDVIIATTNVYNECSLTYPL